jgi:predicted transcriptional regulator
MSEESIDEATKEKQNYSLDNALSVLEELEKEAKMFSEEKMNLLDIEEKLILRINKEIENKRQMREQLKMEVEDLRKKCEGLTNFLNSHIKELGGGV